MSDELALSETLTPFLVALVAAVRVPLLEATRACAACSCSGPSSAWPCWAATSSHSSCRSSCSPWRSWPGLWWRRRIAPGRVGVLATLVVVAPWVGYNMSRFEKPTFISSGLGITLASANCDATWSGTFEGYWSLAVRLPRAHRPPTPTGRCSRPRRQSYALHYIARPQGPAPARRAGPARARLRRLPSPVRRCELDYFVETRPYHWALVGLGHVLRALRPGPGGHRGAAAPSRAGRSRCGPSVSTWSPPCSSASATPGTAPPSRWRSPSWPPCSSTCCGGRCGAPGSPPTSCPARPGQTALPSPAHRRRTGPAPGPTGPRPRSPPHRRCPAPARAGVGPPPEAVLQAQDGPLDEQVAGAGAQPPTGPGPHRRGWGSGMRNRSPVHRMYRSTQAWCQR